MAEPATLVETEMPNRNVRGADAGSMPGQGLVSWLRWRRARQTQAAAPWPGPALGSTRARQMVVETSTAGTMRRNRLTKASLLGSCVLALALAPAMLAAGRPAAAHPSGDPACYVAPFSSLISPCVPHDVPAGSGATVAQLAFFAWQEFIALNWVAMDPASTGIRGRAATPTDPNSGFLGVEPDADGNYPLVVWQTYRHKNELFPADGKTDPTFDSPSPSYSYASQPKPATGGPIPSFALFNNLDETSQIGLDNMYAYADSEVQPPISGPGAGPATGTRFAYQAKVNRAVFDYANKQGFTNAGTPTQRYPTLNTALANTQGNLAKVAGACTTPLTNVVQLPCGDMNVDGDAGEGAIEIKSAWRKLTPTELTSGRFFTRKVIYYTGPQGSQVYHNDVWGLVALHIIHKTKSFPSFVFASWEQVDNYDDTATGSENPNPQTLAFQNTGTNLGNIPVRRANPIHSQVAATNANVHATFKAANPDTVWQYYELIGVQGTPVNYPPATDPDSLSYYYLANIVVETNQTLQNFTGGAPTGVVKKFIPNVTTNGQTVSMGGCQSCHGFQAQLIGGDMSRLIAAAPFNSIVPESLDAPPGRSVRTYRQRSQGVVVTNDTQVPDGVTRWQLKHGTGRIPDNRR
jgi:hypothetical protein